MSTKGKNSLHIRAPWSLTSALREAAERKLTTPSEYVRQAVLSRLQEDGIAIKPAQPPQAVAA